MKTSSIKNRILQFVSVATLFVATSCQKAQEEEVLPQQTEEIAVEHSSARSSASTTYTTAPSLNTYTNCGSVVVSSGTCGTYVGGNIRAKVIKINGSQFVIRIERCNNQQLFGAVGMAYVNATNFCGTQAGKTQIAANHWYSDVTINATFTTGSVDFVPVVILPGQNIRWFGQPIRITSTPVVERIPYSTSSANQTTLSHGQVYGTIGGVTVYANGSNISYASGRNYVNGVDVGLKWQCVELVRRFMLIYFKKTMGAGYHARDFYANARSWNMTSYANGGGMSPKPGDILCFGAAASNNNFGHVEPIIEVGTDYVLVARQNVFGLTHIGQRYSRSGNRINAANVQGWIR